MSRLKWESLVCTVLKYAYLHYLEALISGSFLGNYARTAVNVLACRLPVTRRPLNSRSPTEVDRREFHPSMMKRRKQGVWQLVTTIQSCWSNIALRMTKTTSSEAQAWHGYAADHHSILGDWGTRCIDVDLISSKSHGQSRCGRFIVEGLKLLRRPSSFKGLDSTLANLLGHKYNNLYMQLYKL